MSPSRDARAGARARPGLNGLARERVGEIQRLRILTAMAEVVAEHGVAAVTVAHIVARSGVSRRTFYELFEDREDCFLATFDQAITQASTKMIAAYERENSWQDGIRAGLTALLEFLEDEPNIGTLLIVDALGAGSKALERRARVLAQLIDAVDQGHTQNKASDGQKQSKASGGQTKTGPGQTKMGRGRARIGREPAPLTAEGIVGAVFSVIHARLLARAHPAAQKPTEPLTKLLGPLMATITLPYLGAGAANKELTRPTPTVRRGPRRERKDPFYGLEMRLTYRTVRVLTAIASHPGASNRQVADRAEISDQGQISKLLGRLESLGLITNSGQGAIKGAPNAWTLTGKGQEVEQTIRTQTKNP